ncbi:hypothetical protein ACFX13_026997 [Malus domestica]
MINRELIRNLSFEQLYRVLMNNQSTGRNQRPAKGLKVKQAIQSALILAVCFWLLYQMKQSHGKDYSESSKDKASEERGSDILGRKGSAGWSKGGAVSASEDPKHVGEVSVKKEDGNVEEKTEEESLQNVNEANQVEKETEIQKELNNKDDNSEGAVKGNDESVGLDKSSSHEENYQEGLGTQAVFADQDGAKHVNHDEVGEDKEQIPQDKHDEQENGKGQAKEPKRLEESRTTDKEPKSTTDKEPKSTTYKDISVQRSESKNDSLEGQNSVVDGVVHGFDDVNGVPVDGHDLIESIVTGTGGDQAITGHQEMNSSSNNQSEISKNAVNEEVGSKEGTTGADLEAKSKISVQGSNIDIKSKVETSSDTSRIDSV